MDHGDKIYFKWLELKSRSTMQISESGRLSGSSDQSAEKTDWICFALKYLCICFQKLDRCYEQNQPGCFKLI
jgi:hypothetical protein